MNELINSQLGVVNVTALSLMINCAKAGYSGSVLCVWKVSSVTARADELLHALASQIDVVCMLDGVEGYCPGLL